MMCISMFLTTIILYFVHTHSFVLQNGFVPPQYPKPLIANVDFSSLTGDENSLRENQRSSSEYSNYLRSNTEYYKLSEGDLLLNPSDFPVLQSKYKILRKRFAISPNNRQLVARKGFTPGGMFGGMSEGMPGGMAGGMPGGMASGMLGGMFGGLSNGNSSFSSALGNLARFGR